MKTINAFSIDEALRLGIDLLKTEGIETESRGMRVLEIPEPVATTYHIPHNRVCFSPDRNANPFFHIMEAMWILQGRKDVKFLCEFNKRMAEYSDNGETFHAPYGYRLRVQHGIDQIEDVINLLSKKPDTRQAVMSIWDAVYDLGTVSKDIPCNDMLMFKIREGVLHMTVCNRSNDMLWGAYGANIVQFSFIQEYIASALGIGMGPYTQVSDSFHVYLDGPGGELWDKMKDATIAIPDGMYAQSLLQIGENIEDFNADLKRYFDYYDREGRYVPTESMVFRTAYFQRVISPLLAAWHYYKQGKYSTAMSCARAISCVQWGRACKAWLERAIMNRG